MQVLESLIAGLRRVCVGFTDVRRGQNITYSMEDVGLAAFSLFFMQSESPDFDTTFLKSVLYQYDMRQ